MLLSVVGRPTAVVAAGDTALVRASATAVAAGDTALVRASATAVAAAVIQSL